MTAIRRGAATVLLLLAAVPGFTQDESAVRALSSAPYAFGAGAMFGVPAGATVKFWFPERRVGVDLLALWTPEELTALHAHATVHYHLATIETPRERFVSPYVGLGVEGEKGDDSHVAARLVIGLALLPIRVLPFELFGEVGPTVGLVPDARAGFNAGLGLRFYFARRLES